ncbi:MAG: CRTAC1 family protein [Polyangiales bacterium]
MSARTCAASLVLLLLALGACGHGASSSAEESSPDPIPTSGTQSGGAWFRDVTETSGITVHRSLSQYTNLQDRFSGGVCTLDVDGDGVLDVFFPDDDSLRGAQPRLYRQIAPLRFADETAARGLARTGPMRGCLAFDLEGDGDSDLLLTGLGGARLFRNDGGHFVDLSSLLGPFDPQVLYTSSVAFDADGDGDLDLAIGGFGRYVAPEHPESCIGPCEAMVANWQYGGTRLLLQSDDSSFVDATDLIGRRDEPALVMLATDLDDDGAIDLFVGNDFAMFVDRYFVRRDDGFFEDRSAALGVGFSRTRSGVSSMSTFDADLDGDGHLDLVESSDDSEGNPLFRCVPGQTPVCADVSESLDLDLGPRTFRWGQAMVDFDHDGVLELFEAVGHYEVDPGDKSIPTLGAPLLWHRSDLSSKYTLIDPGVAREVGGRGTSVVDLDGDGDLDVVMGVALGVPMVLENVRLKRGNALILSLSSKGKNRQAIGAKVRVHAGARTFPFVVHAGSSFLSSSEPSLHVGVGSETTVTVDIDWPSGKKSVGLSLPASGRHTIEEP